MSKVKAYIELCKITLSFFSSISSVTGFILAGAGSTISMATVFSGVFLLACGCCSLNQYQERKTDAGMKRTAGRPLPSRRISPSHALYFSLILIIAGLSILISTGKLSVFLLGCCAVILYNGVYTHLKRKTAFASIPCAVIGALPPAIGWFAAGGGFPDKKIVTVSLLFYIWQITHFWLLFLSYGDDYERAGFPSLTKVFEPEQLERIVFVWTLSTAVISLMTPLYGLMASTISYLFLIPTAAWLILTGIKIVRGYGNGITYQSAFTRLNIYILIIMLILSIDKITVIMNI